MPVYLNPIKFDNSNLLYKAEKPSVHLSVSPHFDVGQYLSHGCMDQRQICLT